MHRLFTFFFALLILVSSVHAKAPSCEGHECIAIVDAGSTGSRIHIFSYNRDTTNTPVNIKEVWTKKIKPGFATIEPNKNTVAAYLTLLVANAPNQDLPLYFYSTAGMRLLPLPKQQALYQELRAWFAQQSAWKLVDARTITGNEEALFDWLSVNYHLGTLETPQHSIGVMDMGGASVQVAFRTHEGVSKNISNLSFTIYGQQINLSVHSFLGLGQNEMSHQFLNSPNCFAHDYPLPNSEQGQGNALSCEKDISSLINNVHHVDSTIKPLLAKDPVDAWYAIGGISNLLNNNVFHFDGEQFSNQDLLDQANNQVCNQQWDNLNSQYPNNDYLYGYCLFSSYYYALMVDGYGIFPETPVHYVPENQTLDWTVGAVLHH